jgi:hypothetical protein
MDEVAYAKGLRKIQEHRCGRLTLQWWCCVVYSGVLTHT